MSRSESEIRRALEARTEGMSPAFRVHLTDVIAQGRRPRTNFLPILAGVVAVLITVSAIGVFIGARQLQRSRQSLSEPSPARIGTSSVVPWAAVPAPNQVLPITLPGVSACKASDLFVDVRAEPSYIGRGPLNTSTWNITVENLTPTPCFVGSTMSVQFILASGALEVAALRRGGGDIIYLAPSRGPSGYGLWHQAAGTVLPTPSPLTFNPCPTYHDELEGVSGTLHSYLLNCQQAETIPANGKESFEMFIDVPRGAAPGP